MAFQPIYAIKDRHGRGTLLPYKQGIDDGSTLTLDFTTGVLDPRLTFTRSSDATFINSSGLVQWAASNRGPRTHWNFTNPSGLGWNAATIERTGTFQWVGNGTVIASSGTSGQAYTSISAGTQIAQGIRYVMSVTAQSVTGSPTIQSIFDFTNASGNVYFKNGSTANATTTVASGDRISVSAIADTTGMNIRMGCGAWFADRTNESVTLTQFHWHPGAVPVPYYENTTGSPRYDSARFDYDPTTLAPRGLLLEGQTQNLFTFSENFTDTLWSKIGSTIDTTSVTGPDGVAATTRRVKENLSSDQHGLRRQFTCAANTTYTVSVFIKKGSYDSFVFEFWGGASFNAKIVESNINGSTQPTATSLNPSGVNPSATKTSFPQTGWHRYTLTFTNPSATGTLTDFNVLLKESNSYPGNGTSYMDVYGFSLELGAGASSYIPTGLSQGTRLQDQMQMANLASLGFNTSAGTLTINGTYNKDANSAAYPRSIRFMGTSVQSMAMITSGKTLFGNTPNTSGGSYFEASRTLASAGAFKFGWTLTTAANPALANATVSLNGSSTSITPLGQGDIVNPISLDFLYPSGSALNFPSMNISSLKYWPYATTAADLNVRTSL